MDERTPAALDTALRQLSSALAQLSTLIYTLPEPIARDVRRRVRAEALYLVETMLAAPPLPSEIACETPLDR